MVLNDKQSNKIYTYIQNIIFHIEVHNLTCKNTEKSFLYYINNKKNHKINSCHRNIQLENEYKYLNVNIGWNQMRQGLRGWQNEALVIGVPKSSNITVLRKTPQATVAFLKSMYLYCWKRMQGMNKIAYNCIYFKLSTYKT